MFPTSAVLLLAWGAFAFGAEYAWAYAPLLVWAVMVALLGWLASRGTRFPSRALAAALAAVFLAACLQLVPLPRRMVTTFSPASLAVDYRALYAKATMQSVEETDQRAPSARVVLSIAPSRTALGLAFLGGFALLLVGSTRGLARVGPHGIARAVIVLGTLAAVVGIVQKASGSDVVYGFWHQRQPQGFFAPFNNRNHFAGWAVMAFSLAGGYFAGSVARAFRGVKPDWRHRVLWFSTREASGTLLTAMALFVMATAVILTASRSGLLCLVLATALLIGRGLRHQTTRSRRVVSVSYLVLALAMGAIWGGIDAVLARFQFLYAEFELSGTGRGRVWQDTLQIIRDFPWTGTGLNTYGIAMLHYQTLPRGDYFIEAHNDYLQLASEGGVLVGVPALVALGLFIREVRRRFRERRDDTMTSWLRAGAVTGLVAIAVQEVSDFTLQMPGAAALFVMLAAVAIHEPHHVAHRQALTAPLPGGGASG